MTRFGYHASHEQFPPSELLDLLRAAEAAGFASAMCSDHYHPWGARQGESGFAWSWLGAALQATSFTVGVVTPPMGYRYHPAILAQAAATLEEMFPGRFWLAAGSGEWLNEHVVGGEWPPKEERNALLWESVAVMRALLAGETVSRRGRVTVDRARLWTRPERPPPIFAAALTPSTAEWAAAWSDGLITINVPDGGTQAVVDAYRRGGGGGKPLLVQAHVSWAETEERALANAHDQWRTNVFGGHLSETLATPDGFDAAARHVRPEDVRGAVLVSADLAQHAEWLRDLARMGFDEVLVHNVGRNQREFIEAFGRHVLPEVAGAGPRHRAPVTTR